MATKRSPLTEQEKELFKQLVTNPVLAAQTLLNYNGKPLKLHPHQRIVLRSLWENRPFNMLLLSRGMSKTFGMAFYFTLCGMLMPGQRLGIFSASYRQSQLVFDEIIRFYDESEWVQKSTLKPPTKSPTECSMTFHNRSFIKALPLGDGISNFNLEKAC